MNEIRLALENEKEKESEKKTKKADSRKIESGQSSVMHKRGRPTKENIITPTTEFLVLNKKYENLLQYVFRVKSEN